MKYSTIVSSILLTSSVSAIKCYTSKSSTADRDNNGEAFVSCLKTDFCFTSNSMDGSCSDSSDYKHTELYGSSLSCKQMKKGLLEQDDEMESHTYCCETSLCNHHTEDLHYLRKHEGNDADEEEDENSDVGLEYDHDEEVKQSYPDKPSKSDRLRQTNEDSDDENIVGDKKKKKSKAQSKIQKDLVKDMKKNGKSDDSSLTTPVLENDKPASSPNIEASKTAVIHKVTETASETPTPTSNSFKILPSLFIGLVLGFGFLM